MAKRGTLIFSMLTLLLASVLVVGGTFALFSDIARVGNHLQAGTLDITLKRTNLKWSQIGNEGYLTEGTDDMVVDFTDNTTSNVFGLTDETLVVPGIYYEATMQVSNESDVAFKYWVEVKINGESNELAEQMEVTIDTTEGTITSGVKVGSETSPIGYVEVGGEAQFFTIRIDFKNAINNNSAQGQKVSFDLVVYALQVTEKP